MAKINLLPWREELRKKKKKDFVNTIFLAVLLTVLALGLTHVYMDSEKSYQEARNKILKDEIVILDQKIVAIKTIEEKKAKLLAKIDLITKLQASRPEVVHLLDVIPRVTPDGVFISKFNQVGNVITFEGKSESNARVSAFMKGIEASIWLTDPKLEVIRIPDKNELGSLSDFVLKAKHGAKNNSVNEPAKGGKR